MRTREKIVHSAAELRDVCARLREAGRFALDTEFVRERTYFIRLGIVQVAGAGREAILDPQSLENLAPFLELLSDPSVEKIVHSGEQDFAIFYERAGRAPRNVFDTQVAAALVGYGDQISYARLVEKVAGVRLAKLETLTDWTARPLTKAQISYALEDVRYLPALRDHLVSRLEELRRLSWAREELRRLERAETYAFPPPEEIYLRIKSNHLDPAQRGVLRELAALREREAMRRDIPRGWLLRDPTLVEIARRRPTSKGELRRTRSLKLREGDGLEEEILAAVRRGLARPVPAPERPIAARWQERAEPLARLLEAWLYGRAADAEIAPSMLATRDQLKALAVGHLSGSLPESPILSGWRRELVGQDLLDILSGKLRIEVRPKTGELTGSRS